MSLSLNYFSSKRFFSFFTIFLLFSTLGGNTNASNLHGGGVVSVEPGCDVMAANNYAAENEPIRLYTNNSALIQTVTIKDENGNIVLFETCGCEQYDLFIDDMSSGTYNLQIKTTTCTTTGFLTVLP